MAKGVSMIQKKKFVKAQEYMVKAGIDEKIDMAVACGESGTREAYDVLAQLIRVEDRRLQLTCVKAMEKTADSRNGVHLQWLRDRLPADDKEMQDAIVAAMATSRVNKKNSQLSLDAR